MSKSPESPKSMKSSKSLDHESATDSSDSSRNGQCRCPICRKMTNFSEPSAPFCSERCRTIDLAKWAQGDYKISRPLEDRDLDLDD